MARTTTKTSTTGCVCSGVRRGRPLLWCVGEARPQLPPPLTRAGHCVCRGTVQLRHRRGQRESRASPQHRPGAAGVFGDHQRDSGACAGNRPCADGICHPTAPPCGPDAVHQVRLRRGVEVGPGRGAAEGIPGAPTRLQTARVARASPSQECVVQPPPPSPSLPPLSACRLTAWLFARFAAYLIARWLASSKAMLKLEESRLLEATRASTLGVPACLAVLRARYALQRAPCVTASLLTMRWRRTDLGIYRADQRLVLPAHPATPLIPAPSSTDDGSQQVLSVPRTRAGDRSERCRP